MRHPNVAEVYHYGEQGGDPYLVLEYIPGGTLFDRLQAGPPLAPREAAELLRDTARGVQAAHALGIVHRDLKPHNILLTADGSPKVSDFGLAKLVGPTDLTRTRTVMGTPAYMPPEQANGDAKFVGPQADVWALGVVLYELLTGVRPFHGDDSWALLSAVIRGDFQAPRKLKPALPRDLELICLKCLCHDAAGRYPTAGALADDLDNWLAGRPIRARRAGVGERAWKSARRNKAAATALLAVMATLTAATLLSLWLAGRAIRAEADTAAQLGRTRQAEADAVTRGKEATDALAHSEKMSKTARRRSPSGGPPAGGAELRGLRATLLDRVAAGRRRRDARARRQAAVGGDAGAADRVEHLSARASATAGLTMGGASPHMPLTCEDYRPDGLCVHRGHRRRTPMNPEQSWWQAPTQACAQPARGTGTDVAPCALDAADCAWPCSRARPSPGSGSGSQ